jgi:hypothetical protein
MSGSLDLFSFLGTLSRRDLMAYEKLSPAAKKEAAPFVIMRWLAGVDDAAQIVRLNTFVNPYAFSLGAEKGLLFKLIAAAATGNSGRCQWLRGPGARGDKLKQQVIQSYYQCSSLEASEYVIDAESILEMATELGYDEAELKKLKAEVTDGPRKSPPVSSKSSKRT